MNNDLINKIVQEIKKEKWDYWKNNKLNNYLMNKNYKLSYSELADLTKSLAEQDVFLLLQVIADLVQDLASTDKQFIDLLTFVISKTKADLAQGPFIDSLIKIGKSNARLGLDIATKLLEHDNVASYASFLIGGSANTLPSDCNKIIEQLLHSANIHHQVAAIRTLRVIYRENPMKDIRKIFSILEGSIKNESKEVKLESLEAFLDFYKEDKELAEKNIEILAKDSLDCKFSLAHRIWIRSPFDEETSMKFLEICSEESNINVRQHVCYALIHYVKNSYERILEILARYVIRDEFGYESVGYVLEELGKVNAENAAKIIIGWLTSKDDVRLHFYVPIMIGQLVSKSDKKSVLGPIFQLVESNNKFVNKGLDILLEVLSGSFGKSPDLEFSEKCLNFLKEFAKKNRIDASIVIKNEQDPVLSCADLIHMLKFYSKDLDYTMILNNINEFPNIRDLFGLKWFEQKQKENNRTHSLLKMLEQKLPTRDKFDELITSIKKAQTDREKFNDIFRLKNLMSTELFLLKLDQNICSLKNAGFPLGRYASNMKNERQFDDTLSEIDFIAPFVAKYEVVLEPKINSKRLDVKIDIDAQSIYVEIISPTFFKPLDRLRGVRGIPNRVKGKIYGEFKDQLKELSSMGQPVVVAIDIGRSEIDYDFVKDYLFGTLKFIMYYNKETGETIASETRRDEKESMHELDSETDLISAVICYKTRLYDDLRYKTEGKIFQHAYAKVPLSRSVVKAIEDNLFSKSIE